MIAENKVVLYLDNTLFIFDIIFLN
jgi:hypothetical protein